jgi:SulP family sulfate permease
LSLISKNFATQPAKGPVMDKLKKTDFIEQLKPGKVFFSNVDAVKELA